MEDNKKTELNDDLLNEVAGGRTGMDWGSSAAQADTVPTVPPILLHPDPRPEEDKNTNINPGFTGRESILPP